MKIIPLSATPSQTAAVTLAGQVCKINVYQKGGLVYLDLYVANAPIVLAALCRDRVNVIRRPYLGFVGGLAICDTQGLNDATFDGLGARYLLVYIEVGD